MILRRDGRLTLADGTLAGADIDFAGAIRVLVREVGVALPRALRMASAVPAEVIGMGDRLGRLLPGRSADLVHLDDALARRGVAGRRGGLGVARAPLDDYRGKRDFAGPASPRGRRGRPRRGGGSFVVHKHHATADHYDLRLQVGGVLKSWAVPKGPSLDPAEKRLAVQTEDHPLDYADFEGVIPEGEYGGGPMIVWDAGTWAPMDDVEKSLASGAFKFRLAGEKLNGGWMLARLKPRAGETKVNWLLFKERDPAADAARDILVERPESVKSGRRIEELVAPPPAAKPGRLRPGALPGAVRGPGPEPRRRSSRARWRRRPPGTSGCTRSSSTATGRWPSWRAARCG